MTRTVVLAYHAITSEWANDLATAPETFRAQLERLRRRGFRGATLRDLASGRTRGATAAITFDDGLKSVLEHAKPILDELGWPATVFAVTDFVASGDPLPWLGGATQPPEPRRPLSWDELRTLRDGGWEIGSHTRTHRVLSELTTVEVDDELAGSRAAIEANVAQCTSVSYPLGEVDDGVVAAARRAGYVAGSGLAGRFTRGDPMRIPRFAVAGADGRMRFALKSSPTFVAFRSTRAWDVLDAARRPGRPLGVARP